MNTNGLTDAEDDVGTIPDIIADDMNESGYQEGSENSYGERRDSKEGFAGELDSDSGVDGGVSSGCSIADDCPVVSINDVVAYYDDVRPRRRHAPQLNFYNVDIERLAVDTAQVNKFHLRSALKSQVPSAVFTSSELFGAQDAAVRSLRFPDSRFGSSIVTRSLP